MPTAFCMKCKKPREMSNIVKVTTKRGTPAKKGQCEVCGTKMFRMGG